MSKHTTYFAHDMSEYGTLLEARIMLSIARSADPLNPNQPKHSTGFQRYGMAYFDKHILPELDALAFITNEDGYITSGVAYEIRAALDAGLPVYEYSREVHGPGAFVPNTCLTIDDNWEEAVLTYADTKEYLKRKGTYLD